jgi:hypothetical protein
MSDTPIAVEVNCATGEVIERPLTADDQSKAYRKNYAGIGYSYDESRDAFIPPRPFESWNINEEACLWNAPTPMPETGGPWTWDEPTLSWIEIPQS